MTNTPEEKRRRQIEVGKKINKLVKEGKTNIEIASELGLSESVVRCIRQTHFDK